MNNFYLTLKLIHIKYIFMWIGIIFILIIVLLPFSWIIKNSFIINNDFSLLNYYRIFDKTIFFKYIFNSLFVTLFCILLTLPIALLSSYALVRFDFTLKRYSVLLLILPLIPPISILVPIIILFNKLNLFDTLFSVVVMNLLFNLPFVIWMLRNYIISIPLDIEEVGLIEGCNYFSLLTKITIPLIKPGLIAVSVYLFISVWNNYLFAFAFIASPEKRLISQMFQSWGSNYGGLFASSIICMLPPTIIFLFFQKWLINNLNLYWNQ